MDDRTAWLASVADEFMTTYRLPAPSGWPADVKGIHPEVHPEPDATWGNVTSIAFRAQFTSGEEVTVARLLGEEDRLLLTLSGAEWLRC